MLRRLPTTIAAPTAIAITLAPLVAILAIGIAMNGRPGIGALSAVALLWGVIAPLAAVYPGLAAILAMRSRAETAVVGIAAAAPHSSLPSVS